MNIEDELRAALLREPAPPDFAARVLRKTKRSRWPVYAIAAGLSFAALVGYQGLEARRQLLTALTITRTTLQHTQAKVEQVERHTL